MITLINTVLVTELGILLSLDILYSSSLIALGLIYLTALLLSLWPAFQLTPPLVLWAPALQFEREGL